MEFRILGTLEADNDGGACALGGAKPRALLAVLLLHANEVVSSDRLIDELWGGSPPASAAKALQVHVSQLRKALHCDGAGGPLATRSTGYVLEVEPDCVDVRRFEHMVEVARMSAAEGNAAAASAKLREALGIWRGPPLADFTYESFAQPEISRLTELRLAALGERIELDLELGRHAEVLPELETLVAEHPLREQLRAQMMLALYRAGRQAEALDAYRDGHRLLMEELGIEPGRRLQDLQGAILRHDPALDRFEAPAKEESATPVPDLGILVGRDDQVGQLHAGLDAALQGRGAVFMIGGPAGIGKSRLADELAAGARARGAEALWGRCWEGGGAPAYWPWVQVLRALLHDREGVSVGSVGGAGAAALAELVPELRAASADLPSTSLESEGTRFQLFDAVATLLRESADAQPVVIVLDDLHAADTPSLLLLQFLAGQIARSRLVVAGVYRDHDLHEEPDLTACLAALAREQTTSRIQLTGLTVADTATLIESITGHRVADAVSKRIRAETDGNPLFVGEIVRLLSAEGRLERETDPPRGAPPLPDTVTEVIGQRLDRLGPECRRLLGGASVLGREFGVKELAAVTGIADHAVLEILDEAVAARVLSSGSAVDRVRFSHALVRETLYAGLGPAERRAAHVRAGEALESRYASNPEPHLAELAHHFFEALPAGEPAKAVEYARRAGDRAAQLLAYEEAVRLYALALRALDLEGDQVEDSRCALLLALGDAEARAGDERAARATFLDAADVATRAGLPVGLAQAALGYGGRFVWARAYGDAHLIPLLERALRTLPADASALRVKLMARLAGALRDHQSRERRASISGQAVDMARRLGDPATLAYALDGHCCALLWPETAEERLAIADEVVALAEEVSDDERAIQGHIYRTVAAMELGRMTDAEAALEAVASGAAALRQPAQLWFAAAMRAVVALFRGSFGEAEALIDKALALGESAQRRDAVLSHRLQSFMLWRETGRPAGIETLIDRAVAEFPTRPVFRCALAYARADGAERIVADLAPDDFAVIQRDNEYLFSLSMLADAVHELRDAQAAAILYDLLAPFSHLNAANADELATGSVARPLGILAATMERWDDAAACLDAAIEHNTAMGARPWAAHSRHELARVLLARGQKGDRDRGCELLATARREYEELGMTPWLERLATGAPAGET